MPDGSEPSFNDSEQKADFLNFNGVQSEIVKAWFALSSGGRIKKLKAAVRVLMRGSDGQSYEQSVAMPGGELNETQTPGHFELWPENEPAFRVFTDCQTQWRYLTGGERVIATGLDYSAVVAVMQLYRLDNPDILDDVRICEEIAMGILNAD